MQFNIFLSLTKLTKFKTNPYFKDLYLCLINWLRSSMDRMTDSGSVGCGFESLRGRKNKIKSLIINKLLMTFCFYGHCVSSKQCEPLVF